MTQSSVYTIKEEDLIGNIEYNRKQEIDLIKSITIKYANRLSDFLVSSQYSRRIDTSATNEIVVEMPLALSDDEAKQLCEKALYKDWLYRTTYKLKVSIAFKDIVPGDIITVEFASYIKELRVTNINIDNSALELNCVEHNDANFVSTATGQDTGINAGVVPVPKGPSDFAIMDVPTLHKNYLYEEGVYCAVTGYTDAWSGAVIYSREPSSDDVNAEVAVTGKSAIGIMRNTLGNANPYVFDRINYVEVRTYTPLYSETEENIVRNSLNYIKVGNEILQYADAELIYDNTYKLTNLLRGRLGTEWAMSNHTDNEEFVYLNAAYIQFIPKSLYNTSEYFAATFNGDIDFDNIKTITYNGNNLKPYSPQNITGYRSGLTIVLNWLRRSRYPIDYFNTKPLIDFPQLYEVDVLDLNVALSEKDAAKINYISALRKYWTDFYKLRKITLYDFIEDKALEADFDDLVK